MEQQPQLELKGKNKTLILDKVSRILFPVGFTLFTIIYILIYVIGDNYPALIFEGHENV